MKALYVGDHNGIARKVKDYYIGDPTTGVARRIMKKYVGDANGVARLVYAFGLNGYSEYDKSLYDKTEFK